MSYGRREMQILVKASYVPSILRILILRSIPIPRTQVNSSSCRCRISMEALFRAGGRNYAHQDQIFATFKQRPKIAKPNILSFQIYPYNTDDREKGVR